MDALLAPGSRVLDAGCGLLGAELARCGHQVVGVDIDPVLVAAAPPVPGLQMHVADLAKLHLDGASFDAAVAAGNVLVYTAPGTERAVLQRLTAHLRPNGALVTGFATGRTYSLAEFDADAVAAGLNWSIASPPGTYGAGTRTPAGRSRCCVGTGRLDGPWASPSVSSACPTSASPPCSTP